MSKPNLRKDENELAFDLVRAMTGEGPRLTRPGVGEKNAEAVRRGAKGGKKGREGSRLFPDTRTPQRNSQGGRPSLLAILGDYTRHPDPFLVG